MKTIKKSLCMLLSIVMILGTVVVGFNGFDSTNFAKKLSGLFANKAEAASYTGTGKNMPCTVLVPETIYLKPDASSAKEFQYYVNNCTSKTSLTKEALANQTEGKFYFSCSGTTDIVVKLDGVTADSGLGNTESNKISSTGITDGKAYYTFNSNHSDPTKTTKITLSDGLAPGQSKTVKWTVKYTVNGQEYTTYAYSTVYAPFVGTSSVAAAMSATMMKSDWRSDPFLTGTYWITGGHSISNEKMTSSCERTIASEEYSFYDNPLISTTVLTGGNNDNWSALDDKDDCHADLPSNMVSGSGLYATHLKKSGNSDNDKPAKPIYTTGGTLHLTVDESRYSDYSQIPNLKIGYDINNVKEVNQTPSSSIEYKSDHTATTLDATSTGRKIDRQFEGAFISGDLMLSSYIDGQYDKSQYFHVHIYNYIYLNTTIINKSTLRSSVQDSVNAGYQEKFYSNYSTYLTSLSNASKVLGNPASSTASASITAPTPKTYTITYNANDGATTTTTQTFDVTNNSSLTLAAAPSRTGYTFTGWKVTSENNGDWKKDTVYNAGDTLQYFYGDVTLEAQWIPNKTVITFDKENLLDFTQFTYWANYHEHDNVNKSLKIGYNPSQSYQNVTVKNKVAIDKTKEYIFSYHVEKTGSAQVFALVYFSTDADSEKENYCKDASSKVISKSTATISSGDTYIIITKEDIPSDCASIRVLFQSKYNSGDTTASSTITNIRFSEYDSTAAKYAVTATYDAAMPDLDEIPTRTGYTFGGYFDGVGGTGKQYYTATGDGVNGVTWDKNVAKTTLYAKWDSKNYEVGYDNLFLFNSWADKAGSLASPTGNSISIDRTNGKVAVTTGTGEKDNYTVYGTNRYNIPVSPNTEYVFRYTVALSGESASEKYQVFAFSYDGNTAGQPMGGKGYENLESKYNKETAISPVTDPHIGVQRTSDGTYLLHFKTGENTSNVQFRLGCSGYTNQTATFSDIGLYTKETYDNIIRNNESYKTRELVAYTDEGTYTGLLQPERAGYTFDGWYSDASLTTKVSDTTKLNAYDMTLYSKWKGVPLDVNYDNMFSVQDWLKSESGKPKAGINMTVSSGENNSIVLSRTATVGDGTYSTDFENFNGYKIPVTGGQEYSFLYDSDSVQNIFFFIQMWKSDGTQINLDESFNNTFYGTNEDKNSVNVYYADYGFADSDDGYICYEWIKDCNGAFAGGDAGADGYLKSYFTVPENCAYITVGFGFRGSDTIANITDIQLHPVFYDGGGYQIGAKKNSSLAYSKYSDVFEYGSSGTLTPPEFTGNNRLLGYEFGGWYDNAEFSGSAITSINKADVTATKHLYSKWIAIAENDTFIMDFGTAATLDVLSNDGDGLTVTEVGLITDMDGEHFSDATVTVGTGDNAGKIVFTPNKILSSAVEFYYSTDSTVSGKESAKVTIIPANNVYYEEDIVSFTDAYEGEVANQAYDWHTISAPDPAAVALKRAEDSGVFGYDGENGAYATSTANYSLGKAKTITVNNEDPTRDNYTAYAQFTFKGTGFDLYSITNNNCGSFMACVVEGASFGDGKLGTTNKLYNTYCGYTYSSGKWTPDSGSTETLYQVPVISMDLVYYKTYTVRIYPLYTKSADVLADGSYEFVLDGIRIYNPMGTSNAAYNADKENDAKFLEIRDKLIAADSFGKEAQNGVAFCGINWNNKETTFEDYEDVGPKNEVYLAPDQAISFDIEYTGGKPDKVAVGVRLLTGTSGSLAINSKDEKLTISSKTDLFRDITSCLEFKSGAVDGSGTATVILANNSETDVNISLTKLKVTYASASSDHKIDPKPAEVSAPARSMVGDPEATERTVELVFNLEHFKVAVERFFKEKPTIDVSEVNVEWEKTSVELGDPARLFITAPEKVTKVTVDGSEVSGYETLADGSKKWTFVTYGEGLGNKEFNVVAFVPDGEGDFVQSQSIGTGIVTFVKPVIDIKDAGIEFENDEIKLNETTTLNIETSTKVAAVYVGDTRYTDFDLKDGKRVFTVDITPTKTGKNDFVIKLESITGDTTETITKSITVTEYVVDSKGVTVKWSAGTIKQYESATLTVKTAENIVKVEADGKAMKLVKTENGEKTWEITYTEDKPGTKEVNIKLTDENEMKSENIKSGKLTIRKLTFWERIVRFFKKLFGLI